MTTSEKKNVVAIIGTPTFYTKLEERVRGLDFVVLDYYGEVKQFCQTMLGSSAIPDLLIIQSWQIGNLELLGSFYNQAGIVYVPIIAFREEGDAELLNIADERHIVFPVLEPLTDAQLGLQLRIALTCCAETRKMRQRNSEVEQHLAELKSIYIAQGILIQAGICKSEQESYDHLRQSANSRGITLHQQASLIIQSWENCHPKKKE